MTKLSFMIVAAGLLATSAITSCKKEAVKGTTTSTSKTNGSKMRIGSGEYCCDHNDGCYDPGDECMTSKEIIITNLMINNIANAGSNSTLTGTLFSDPSMQNLCNHLDANMVSMLQSGNYYISSGYVSNDAISYRVGLNYPVTKQNKAFAFQFNYQ